MTKDWIKHFDAIVYINMQSSVERRAHIEKEFASVSHKLHRIEAVTPETLPLAIRQKIVNSNSELMYPMHYDIVDMSDQRQIELCVSYSHAKALQLCSDFSDDRGWSKFLIIEDDTCIEALDDKRSNDLTSMLDSNEYDILQLGYTTFTGNVSGWLYEREYAISIEQSHENWWLANSGIFGLYGYAVRIQDDNAQEIVRCIGELQNGVIADFYLSEQKWLTKRIFREKLLVTSDARSTISNIPQYAAVNLGANVNIVNNMRISACSTLDKSKMSETRCAYVVVASDACVRTSRIDYSDDKFLDQILEYISILDDHCIDAHTLYVVKFLNKERPNLGEKTYIKQNSKYCI